MRADRGFSWLAVCVAASACSGGPGDRTSANPPSASSAGNAGTSTSAGSGSAGTTSSAGTNSAGGAPSSAGSSSANAGNASTTLGGNAGSSSSASGSTGSGGSGAASGAGSVTSAGAGGATNAGAGGAPVDQGNLPATTVHLAGDSTVMYYPPPSAQEGWGQELGQYFIDKVSIDNQALGGTSVQTFHTDGRWAHILAALKPGDFVMADFGINDSGGVGDRGVTPANFQLLMLQMSGEVTAKQASFIIVTPSALQYWSGGMDTNARLAPYVAVENMLGTMNQIPIDDLNARSLEYLNTIGQTAAMQIYINGDKAHFTKMGATQMANFVTEELARIHHPLANYLK